MYNNDDGYLSGGATPSTSVLSVITAIGNPTRDVLNNTLLDTNSVFMFYIVSEGRASTRPRDPSDILFTSIIFVSTCTTFTLFHRQQTLVTELTNKFSYAYGYMNYLS
jgi:hypothetical protein